MTVQRQDRGGFAVSKSISMRKNAPNRLEERQYGVFKLDIT